MKTQWMLSLTLVLLSASVTQAAPDTVAVFPLSGAITEQPAADDFPFSLETSESLRSLIGRMDKAAKDDDVAGVVILLEGSSLGLAQAQEIQAAMQRLRDAGKPVYTHADTFMSTGSYALMCGSSRISMTPTGYLFITGVYAEHMYLRGLFDKLGVKPDFVTCGDYKSAAETYMRTGPSEPATEMYEWLYGGLFDSMVDMIAKGRHKETDAVKGWIDTGLFSSEGAKEAGMIDAVEHKDQFVARMKEQFGEGMTFDKKYGKKKPPTVDLNNPFGVMQLYMQLLTGPTTSKASKKDSIAIVYVEGPIMDGKAQSSPFGGVSGAYSDPIRRALEKAANDDTVKGVVLRVDSPGGSAVASEVILNAAKSVGAKKPIVVSMGNVAGSGGYYVACCSDTIIADEATITGSIGVLGGKISTTGLWDKTGIEFHATKRGERAGMMATDATFTDAERAHISDWMHEVYDVFKKHVTDIRGDKLTKPIDEIAGGRVYTGKQALALGLVDRIGTLEDAIALTAKKAGLSEYEVRTIPEPTNFLEVLLGDLAGEKKEDGADKLSVDTETVFSKLRSTMATRGTSHGSLWEAVAPMLSGLDPDRVRLVQRGFLQLEMIRQEQVLMSMPLLDVGL